jgi:hypothetical protein
MEPSRKLKTASVNSLHHYPSLLRLASESGRNIGDGNKSGKNGGSAKKRNEHGRKSMNVALRF